MRANDLVRLEVVPRRLSDPFGYLESLVAGKAVLNVGAAGGIKGYLPGNRFAWLHHRLQVASASVIGVDIDKEAIEYARKYGVEILEANCENMDLNSQFDVIVLSDVIEHLNAPVNAIENLMRHLRPTGALCITTPNATSGLTFGQIVTGRPLNVYRDHMAIYSPEHIQALCDRCGFRLTEVLFFDHIDRRTLANTFKSYAITTVSRILPRLSSSFMAVVRHA